MMLADTSGRLMGMDANASLFSKAALCRICFPGLPVFGNRTADRQRNYKSYRCGFAFYEEKIENTPRRHFRRNLNALNLHTVQYVCSDALILQTGKRQN